MANTLNIAERTLAQMANSTNTINLVGPTHPRKSAYQPLVVRATNHADNDGTETGADTDKMAIFKSSRVGEPWEKQNNVLIKKIVQAPANLTGFTVDTQVSVLFPNYDYSTFE